MAEIAFYQQTFGAGDASRRPIRSFDLDVDTISVADIIRLRVEAQYEGAPGVVPGSAEWLRRHAQQATLPTLEAAIEEARRGLLSNAYFLVVNGRQRRDLEERIGLDHVNQAVFLQLVPLKGG
jgi:hypothetical protein